MAPAVKACVFPCGRSQASPDPVDPSKKVRWAYADGSGCCDWYCQKAFLSRWSHKFNSRQDPGF